MTNKLIISGTYLGCKPIETVGDKGFKKRAFYVDLTTDAKYPNTPEFTLTQKNVDLVDGLDPKRQHYAGDQIEVTFELKGTKYKNKTTGKAGIILQLTATNVRKINKPDTEVYYSLKGDENDGGGLPF